MIDENILKSEEKAVFALRSLYRKYGYLPYKMSKFEAYEYYIRNKDFLVSDRIITFNDTNGRLMALKPDVTLSILKHGEDQPGCKQKVCYNENVYRVSAKTGQFKEIMQAGLECIGDIDLYDIFETVTLAARSLALISGEFALQISHLGILAAMLEPLCPDDAFRQEAIGYISGKNIHDLKRLCARYGVDDAQAEKLAAFAGTYGPRQEVIAKLEDLCAGNAGEALAELKALSALLDGTELSDRITFDFSVVGNMSYYNGFVFKGYLDGIFDSVLSGGQYDRLMKKMGRKAGAVGFALYLDLLEQLSAQKAGYDVDVLLLYTDKTDKVLLSRTVQRLTAEGKRVSAQKAVPAKLRCREVINMEEDAKC